MIEFKIHIRMAEHRLTQKEVSTYVGITPSVMGKYFHGTITRINPEHLDKFCKLFNCNTQDLIEYIPDEETATK
ncbi:helix-turn-helix domain-containing protein [Fusobacterium hominis]|uniref:Helix-turn-helix transcriptional regulator n=1 Tax=Fusobacterium hominis TaxID=2764326 RepID=A0A7G9GXG4_9FUSO|nr:helix-turn-helix transcriptional regulator [Fusobacterium hominis]QNM15496.1 helix-turn-helix transcriptional regulator [Fusobacterium hominis]